MPRPAFLTLLVAAATLGAAPDAESKDRQAGSARIGSIPLIQASDWTPTTDAETQFKRDITFFLATLAPQPGMVDLMARRAAAQMKLKDKDDVLARQVLDGPRRVRILTHVFLAMAYGGLKYSVNANDPAGAKPWGWSLATALAHGGRVLFHCKGFGGLDLYQAIVEWNPAVKGSKDPFPRASSTHAVDWVDGRIVEKAYKGVSVGGGVVDGLFLNRQHGVDIPAGGVGNPWIAAKSLNKGTWPRNDYLVGPTGYAVDATTFKVAKDLQHGHLFMCHNDLRKAKSDEVLEGGLLAGLETCAFGTTNMFGYGHTIASNAASAATETSVFGGVKMPSLLTSGPNKLGGMWVILGREDFKALQGIFQKVDNQPLTEKKVTFFRDLLSADGSKARKVLDAYLKSL